jgi:hypothetical protein
MLLSSNSPTWSSDTPPSPPESLSILIPNLQSDAKLHMKLGKYFQFHSMYLASTETGILKIYF